MILQLTTYTITITFSACEAQGGHQLQIYMRKGQECFIHPTSATAEGSRAASMACNPVPAVQALPPHSDQGCAKRPFGHNMEPYQLQSSKTSVQSFQGFSYKAI